MELPRVHPGSRSVSFACCIDHQSVKQRGARQTVYVRVAQKPLSYGKKCGKPSYEVRECSPLIEGLGGARVALEFIK